MKTRFFSFVAALLLSVCAFAQSGNIDPARGDVNGDGVVDVADITAVIGIMKNGGGTVQVNGYFYLGTTQPTAENYQTLPGVVTTYSSIDEAVGATASVASGQTVYMLCPAAWVKEKSVALEDRDGNTIDFLEEKDATTISGYVIYKTQALNAPNNVVLKTTTTYYYSAGTTEVTTSNYTSANNATAVSSVSSIPSSLDISSMKGYVYIVLPNAKEPNVVSAGGDFPNIAKTITSISGHTVYKVKVGTGATLTIVNAGSSHNDIQEQPTTTYYWYVGTTVPTDPTNTTQNTGNNKWTSLGTDLPTSDIEVAKVDTSYNFSTWYIAAPSAANFTLYNATNVASNEATWNKSTFNVGSVQYTLWTSKATSFQAVEYLHK